MGYSVHGNEASGSNASVLVAYFLAAAQGKEIEAALNDAVPVPVVQGDSFSTDYDRPNHDHLYAEGPWI